MSEENAATNLEKSTVDGRVDKLEAIMQTMAAILQTISLTLSTLATSSVPSPTPLIPTIPVPPVPTITPGNRAKDPMVTQLQFPSVYENQPLVGESSSHAPQISSLPFETSYPPFEVNNPTLSTTSPLTLNIPPLMGQVPTIQANPLVAMLRPALEDGKSREVDHKLQQLEEALKAMQGPQAYGCPYAHLQMYARKMAPYANDERVFIHYFQDNLSGPASVWFSTLDKKKIRTFKDVSQAFMKQYEYNMSLTPTRDSLQKITKKSNETFKEFAQRWRSEAGKVMPPLTNSEICSLFIKSTTGTFHASLAPCVGYTFAQLVTVGEQIEDGLKTDIIMDFQAIQKQLEQVKMGSAGSTSKKFAPGGRKEDEEALSHISTCHNVANIPYKRRTQMQYTPAYKPTTHSQRRPNFNAHTSLRQQFPSTNKSRQFTKLPIPYDLIDEGKLQFDEAKSTSNITQNPLPPYNAGTMNMVALDEVGKPMLENASFWSLDELLTILTKYGLIQPIAQMSLNVSLAMIDDALVSEKCVAQFEEVIVEDIIDEVCSDDEEYYFGFNNLFGSANMVDPKETRRRILVERAFMEKQPNFHLVHHVKAPMDSHESMSLELVKEESLCDSWGNLTMNALDEEESEFDTGISLVSGSFQANWTAKLLPAAFIFE
ncbi:hypothetical protein SLEP1_g53230 [Rubroshorea leprosula]|uniref:Retrotransposon gag domain-containing protein n=1 Tax=Rubroshorea leprosula TaxID=152421 RepID=A0AAV5M8Y3_9ROSI|nr:hypothetical protein SLEP1_g53230 [Rubroshorea leprosula]